MSSFISKPFDKVNYDFIQFDSFKELKDSFSGAEIVNFVNSALRSYQIKGKCVKVAKKLDTKKIDVDIIKAAFNDVDLAKVQLVNHIKSLVDKGVSRKIIYDTFSVDKDFVDSVVNE